MSGVQGAKSFMYLIITFLIQIEKVTFKPAQKIVDLVQLPECGCPTDSKICEIEIIANVTVGTVIRFTSSCTTQSDIHTDVSPNHQTLCISWLFVFTVGYTVSIRAYASFLHKTFHRSSHVI